VCSVTRVWTSDDLRELETRRLAAIVAGDAEVLRAVHAPDFQLCTPTGTVWTRQHYLDGLIDGTIDYHRFEPVTPVEVVLDSTLAALRYRSVIEISIDHGPLGRLACWHLDVYQFDGTAWTCRWSQATDTIRDQTDDR
jgi:hypothetical protein